MIYNKLMNQTRAESLRADQMRAESTKLMSLVTLHVLADRTSSSNFQRLVLHRLWVATMRGIRNTLLSLSSAQLAPAKLTAFLLVWQIVWLQMQRISQTK